MREKQEGSQFRQKSQSFRKSIRQKTLDTFFEERRKQIMMRNNMQTLFNELSTTIKQHDFLAECGRQLTGQPQHAWSMIIFQLRKIVALFSGQFDVWISQNIISSLSLALKIYYKPLMLAPEICTLFADMVFLSWENGTVFIQKLMEYEPVSNIIAHLDDGTTPIEGRLQMLLLLGNIASNKDPYRTSIIRDGVGRIFIQIGHQLLKMFQTGQFNQLLFYKYLSSSTGFLTIFNKQKKPIVANLNFVNSYLPILIQILTDQKSNDRTLVMGMRCLVLILGIEKQALYSTIFQFKNLIQQLISLLLHPQAQLRLKAAISINYLTYSEKFQISAEFLSLGVLEVLVEADFKYGHTNTDKFKRTVSIIISNIAANSEAMAETIFNHPIMKVLLQQFQSQNVENMKNAFFALDSIVDKLKFNSLQKLINQLDVMKYLIKGILELRGVDSKTVFQILSSISILLQRTQVIYYQNSNPLIDKLERIYNFSLILENLFDNGNNKLLNQIIQKIQNQLLQTHMNDSPI